MLRETGECLMPKIRGIKPETWTDENFVELSPHARLLFIGMWNYACDNGHLEDRSNQLKMRLLPADDVSCADLLRELEGRGRITRAGGYITIPRLREHQRTDKRWFQTCEAPGCARPGVEAGKPEPETRRGHNGATTSARRGHHVTTSGPRDELSGVDVELSGVDGELMVSGGDLGAKRRRRLPDDWQPNQQHHGYAVANQIDLAVEWPQFADHHRSKGTTMLDWDAAFRNWLRNAVKFRARNGTGPANRHEPDPEAHVQRFLARGEGRQA